MSTEQKIYTVFIRNWWKVNKTWPEGLEPDPHARKTVLRRNLSHDEAVQCCKDYNTNHNPGKLSRKAEFTSNY